MRVLIDECLNWRLGRALTGHYVTSVARMGWSGISNGRLLALAQDQFDVLITGDRNLSFQQTMADFRIAVVVLQADGTQPHQTLPPMAKVLALMPALEPGTVTIVGAQ